MFTSYATRPPSVSARNGDQPSNLVEHATAQLPNRPAPYLLPCLSADPRERSQPLHDSHQPALAPLQFTEAELAAACAAALLAGRRAALAAIEAKRGAALDRALARLEGVAAAVGSALATEVESVAQRAAELLADVISGLEVPGHGRLSAVAGRQMHDAVVEAAGNAQLLLQAGEEVVSEIGPGLERLSQQSDVPVPIVWEADRTLPPDAVRLSWSAGWSEVRAGAALRLLRERLAAQPNRHRMEARDELDS